MKSLFARLPVLCRCADKFVQVFALGCRRYGVAITWDPVDYAKPVDLDLQAIIVDKRGYIEACRESIKTVGAV